MLACAKKGKQVSGQRKVAQIVRRQVKLEAIRCYLPIDQSQGAGIVH